MTINIKEFLNPDPLHEWQRAPFNLGNRTVASSHWVLISVPKDDQYEPLEKRMTYRVQAVLNMIKNQQFSPMPAIEMPELIGCTHCNSTGHTHTAECRECLGDGFLEFATNFNDYSPTCLTCKGKCVEILPGGNTTCLECNGRGASFHESYIKIGGININPNLLALILKAPGLQIATDKETETLFFKAGDAEGAIAGI